MLAPRTSTAARAAAAALAPQVIIVEGIIAAGKSEFCKVLGGLRGRVCTILEPVDEWVSSGALAAFYENPIGMAYAFQTYAYATRLINICKKWDPKADYVIIERSPISDKIFMEVQRINGSVTPIDMHMYNTWCTMCDKILPFRLHDAVIIYLNNSVSMCMTRLFGRARSAESGDAVSTSYQELLLEGHEHVFGSTRSQQFASIPNAGSVITVLCPPKHLLVADYRNDAATKNAIISWLIGKLPPRRRVSSSVRKYTDM